MAHSAALRARALASLLLLLGASALPLCSRAATPQELEARVQALAEQLQALREELAQVRADAAAGAERSVQAEPPAGPAPAAPTLFGYGELNLSTPRNNAAAATADVARFVIGLGYRFDERTRLVSELEVEHAVSSASDPGEVEVEQAYIERELSPSLYAKLGLFLMPVGLLNENHEPTRYYGVQRNAVETAIIPTTWREGGVGLQGNTEAGLRWDLGLTTGFDLSKWDAAASEGAEAPLASIHQELAIARAAEPSGYLALNYSGLPGLLLGGSFFTGGASQKQPGLTAARVTLWEGHARWTPGRWDLSALYAQGHISNTAGINRTLLGNPTLIPEAFYGWYGQAAFRAYAQGSTVLAPFLRLEQLNTGSAYADLGAGLTPLSRPTRQLFTGGVNWQIAPGVVIKADYVEDRHDASGDRYDLGIGYQF